MQIINKLASIEALIIKVRLKDVSYFAYECRKYNYVDGLEFYWSVFIGPKLTLEFPLAVINSCNCYSYFMIVKTISLQRIG